MRSYLVFLAFAISGLALACAPEAVAESSEVLRKSVPSASPTPAPPTIGERFAGEEHSYTISFWILDEVAVGKITLSRDGDVYVATLHAHTTGLARWFRKREDNFTAILEETADGKRFRTLRFEKTTKIGRKTRKSVTVIDHDRHVMKWEKWNRGRLKKTGSLVFTPGTYYDDPLGALFNLRYGVYGPVEEGGVYHIKTFPKRNKEVDIYLSFATVDEFKKQLKRNRNNVVVQSASYFARVKLDKELFDSKTGKVELYFDESLVPVRAVAKDVMLFGDVRGDLVSPGLSGQNVDDQARMRPSDKGLLHKD